jgi:hypothetical protein
MAKKLALQLFDNKIFTLYKNSLPKPTKEQVTASEKWLDYLLKTNKLEKEKANYTHFYQTILHDLLGYSDENVKFEENNVEYQVIDDNGKTIGCFELKGTVSGLRELQDRKESHATPLLQTKTYCGDNGWRYGICTNYKDFILFDMHRGWSKEYEFDFTSIQNDEEKLKEFIGIFSRKNLVVKNQVDELGKNSMDVEEDIETKFYELFHRTRLMLMEELRDTSKLSIDDAKHYAQLYLNRLIFMFFVEDNGQIESDFFKKSIMQALQSPSITESSHKISQEILGLFDILKEGSPIKRIQKFNGGLFKETIPPEIHFLDLRDESYHKDVYLKDINTKDLKLTEKEKDILEKYRGGLNPIIFNLLKMARYDFNGDITVDILGHIFEQSLTDLDEIEKSEGFEEKKKAQKSKRKHDAIYYTFDYITSYICRNTIIPYLSKTGVNHVDDLIREYSDNLDELSNKIKTLKILDPACGSGAFLIKAAEILLVIDTKIQLKKGGVSNQTIEQFSGTKEIAKIIEKNLYGVDINNESVEITKLSMFLRLVHGEEALIDLSENIVIGNSLIDKPDITKTKILDWDNTFSEIKQSGGFDIIIGNPPYGAELTTKEQNFLNKKFELGSTDTAQLMMKLSYDLLKPGGYHGFIVPKALIYANNWKKTRDFILEDLEILIDVGKVWQEVKLEQAIYILKKGTNSNSYLSGKRVKEYLHAQYNIDKKYCKLFGFFLSEISEPELKLGERIFNDSEKLGKFIQNSRGEIYQKFVTEQNGVTVMGGKQVQRYHLNGIYGYMKKQNVTNDKANVGKNSILAQRLVAHILNPVDHIKITATIPERDDFIIIDTINQLKITDKSVSPYFILGLLNSKITNWYAYRFIFGKAIRTMQFDNPVTNRLPIIIDEQKKIESSTKQLIKNSTELLKIQQNFKDNLKAFLKSDKLTSTLKNFQKLDFTEFSKNIEKILKRNLSPNENKEWLEIFNDSKNNAVSKINEITNLNDEINQLLYQVFSLTKDEIELIESTTPE